MGKVGPIVYSNGSSGGGALVKFVCENCKAKYQISDDKVAGRTLRMKCRRCGEMIQVAATVTESSVSQKLPAEQVAGSAPSPIRATPPPRAAVEAPSAESPSSPGDDAGNADEGATVIRQSPFFHPDPKPTGPALGAAPRPNAPRIIPPARASLSGAGARSSRPPPPPGSGPGMHAPSSPGLHAGFARAVATAPRSPSSQPLPTEDWYVGIGGVPLGPVRLAVLRDKAAAGQVDGDSLVWREGFDEWQAIKSIQPLMALVDEAKQTRASRMSLPAVVPPAPRPSQVSISQVGSGSPEAKPAAAAAASLSGGLGAGLPPPAPSLPFDLVRSSSPGAPAAAPPSDPFSSAVAPAALSGAAINAPSLNGSAPHGAAANGSAANGGTTANAAFSVTTAAGLAGSGTPSIGSAPVSELSPQSMSAGRKRGGLPPAAWALIAMAAAFGGVAAWALFLRPNGAAQNSPVAAATQTQKADQPLGASPPPPPGVNDKSSQTPEPGASAATGPTGQGNGGPRGPAGSTPSSKPTDSSPIDKTGFQPTPGGPSTSDPPPSNGGALTEGEINGVVSRNKPMITRRCWLPAYDARSSNAPSTAKVSVSLKVAPSGSVSSVSAGGAETHYPGLAGCIAGAVKGWSFPPSDEGATINIPFSFSGQ